jgi:hypothetical protein
MYKLSTGSIYFSVVIKEYKIIVIIPNSLTQLPVNIYDNQLL